MSTSFDLSNVSELRSLAEIVQVVSNAADAVVERWIIVGATARDIILQYVCQCPKGRKTVDLDIAVAIRSWGAFETLEKRLLKRGARPDRRIAHRFSLNDWKLDIVPFGGVEQDGVIAWPPDHDTEMSVTGFEEMSIHAWEVQLPSGVHALVASPPGLLILKLIAWEDRHRTRPHHDAVDIRALIDSYDQPWNQDRVYGEADDLLQRFGYDNSLAAAALLGRDAATIAQASTLDRVRSIVERAALDESFVLAADMGGRVNENVSLLEAVLVGLRDARR
jgi:predicted nucleotidyltransferase